MSDDFPLKNADQTDQYESDILHLPIPPMAVSLMGSDHDKKQVRDALTRNPSLNVFFPREPGPAKYLLSIEDGNYLLKHRENGQLIQEIHPAQENRETCIQYVFSLLEHLERWERKLALNNPDTKLDTALVDFRLIEMLDNERFHAYEENDITLDYVKEAGLWKRIKIKLQARNRSPRELHVALYYFSPDYGVHPLKNALIKPGQEWLTLYGEGEYDNIYLPEDVNQDIDVYKLFVSTEKVDENLLTQKDLETGKRIFPGSLNQVSPPEQPKVNGKKITYDWFIKSQTCTVVRLQARVSPQDTQLAKGKVLVKGHPTFKANISISGAPPPTRSMERETMTDLFSDQGFQPVDLSAGHGASRGITEHGETVLELTDIQNSEDLEKEPLVIVLDTPLKEDEFLLPITFDGEHFLPVGEFFKEQNGAPAVRIRHIPKTEAPTTWPGYSERRSLGKALKLCFYKLVLGRNNINQLCWVEYTSDNKVLRRPDKVKERATGANDIILLVHGIIGDTKVMARGLKLAADEKNTNIADRYDLVLTYDYENLNTPLHEMALQLKAALKEVGIHEQQQKKITILAHSMGGLVSRWLIEQEGGDRFVKHLVMAGTPNNGSVFGNIGDYKDMAITTLTLSLNFTRPLAAHAGGLLYLLAQSDKLLTSLDQMKEDSTFIRHLALTGDPHVKYTILAGDITHYRVDNQGRLHALLEKIKTSVGKLAYGNLPNDIAVSVASIKHVEEKRQPPPEKIDLVCHHLNYFSAETSLNALKTALVPGE